MAEFGSNDNREAVHSLYTSSYPLFGVKTCEELENERFRFGDWENIFQTCQSTMRKSVLCENCLGFQILKVFFFNLYWSPWELLQNWWETAAKETSIKLFLASAVFGFLWVNALFDSDAVDNLGIYHLVFFSFPICLKLKSSHFSGRFTFNWMYNKLKTMRNFKTEKNRI